MSISHQDLENAILTWVFTFQELTNKPENFESLSDGITLTEIMHRIESNVFDLNKVNSEVSDNWALRLNNLSYLYEGLEHYYTNILHKIFDKNYVDVVKVSKNDKKDELYKLVQLVLGAAVQCPDKELYINEILALDESCQNALMDLIEKILHKSSPEQTGENEISPSLENAFGRNSLLSTNIAMKADNTDKNLLVKLEELENENQNLNLKFNDLNQEKEQLKIRVNDLLAELDKKGEEIQLLIHQREEIQERLTTQESIEEVKNELKLKDLKYEQLEKFIEELKQKHEDQVSKLESEVDKQKKRVSDLTKIEATIEFYKQKCEDYASLNDKINEVQEEAEKYRKKIDELTKANEAIQGKMNTYKEKLEAEKTTNISLDIELTKKKTEIETLKSEKKRLEATNNDLENKVHDQNKAIEKHIREREERSNYFGSTDRTISQFQEFQQDDSDQKSGHEGKAAAISEGEKEILEQENNILKAKCKEIQIENEELKGNKNSDSKTIETLTNENNNLKQEIEKLKIQTSKASNGDSTALKEMVDQKTMLINQLNEEIVSLKSSSQAVKKLEEDNKNKDDEIKELTQQLEALQSIATGFDSQKEDELKVLSAAIHELALRILELERQLVSRDGLSSVSKTSSNIVTVPQTE